MTDILKNQSFKCLFFWTEWKLISEYFLNNKIQNISFDITINETNLNFQNNKYTENLYERLLQIILSSAKNRTKSAMTYIPIKKNEHVHTSLWVKVTCLLNRDLTISPVDLQTKYLHYLPGSFLLGDVQFAHWITFSDQKRSVLITDFNNRKMKH